MPLAQAFQLFHASHIYNGLATEWREATDEEKESQEAAINEIKEWFSKKEVEQRDKN